MYAFKKGVTEVFKKEVSERSEARNNCQNTETAQNKLGTLQIL